MKDVERWVIEWENAIFYGIRVKWTTAVESSEWFLALMTALRYTPMATWVEAYESSKKDQAIEGILTYRKVILDMRACIAAEPDRPRAKVSRGAFGPVSMATTADLEDQYLVFDMEEIAGQQVIEVSSTVKSAHAAYLAAKGMADLG
ncbi:hypothetical protein LY78DRAFT_674411 [Colletotrichum sublineola]|nr:hypothetical protein LY78DRAFT_674411 [Colletotrichum sublineola]